MGFDQHKHSYQDILLTESSPAEPTANDNPQVLPRLHSITQHNNQALDSPYEYSQFVPGSQQIYLQCTAPLDKPQNQANFFINSPLIRSSLEFINIRSLKPVEFEVETYPMVDVNGNHLEAAFSTHSFAHHQDNDNDNDQENSLAKRLFPTESKRGSAQAEVMKSLNNIRLNMSHQHLIESSRNLMGKMRAIAELNKQSTSMELQPPAVALRRRHQYKTQFYAILTLLALLFLYLIYQNLFSDKWLRPNFTKTQ